MPKPESKPGNMKGKRSSIKFIVNSMKPLRYRRELRRNQN